MIKRYSIKEIDYIWSDENKFNIWEKIELLVCKAWNELKVIPDKDIKELEKKINFNIDDIYEIEKETKHDVVAFTRAISKSTNSYTKKWIHYGLTSTDIVDTYNAIAFKEVNNIIAKELNSLSEVIKTLAFKHKKTYQIGRTHGVHAEITTFGLKMALWYAELDRNIKRFNNSRQEVETGKISGAVGTFANTGTFIQDYVCKQLKINSAKISTQILQRDRHANYFSTLATIGGSLEKFATEIRHLQRTEVYEVQEGFGKNQKGSSAMPHKKNPISSENICGMSRLLRGYSLVANENMNLWHERDISHSSSERVIFLDATTTLVYMLRRFQKVLKNIFVDEEQMLKNIKLTNGLIFSQTILLFLINQKNLEREEAYDLIQPIAMECWNKKTSFKESIKKSKIMNFLSEKELEKLFDYNYHCRFVDEIYGRVFNGKIKI